MPDNSTGQTIGTNTGGLLDRLMQFYHQSINPPTAPNQPTWMDRLASGVSGDALAPGNLEKLPQQMYEGVGNALGRTTQAWHDMFTGRAKPQTLAEMIPMVGPQAVDLAGAAQRQGITPELAGAGLAAFLPMPGAGEMSSLVKASGLGRLAETEAKPTYYSNAAAAFENPKVPQKLTSEQALAVLKHPGVKAEENKWLGLEEKLKSQPKWDKKEISQYIQDHQIDVHHKVLDTSPVQMVSAADWTPVERAKYGPDKHPNLSLPGGSNYREHLLTWGNKPVDALSDLDQSDFQSGHFDDPNILAHFRTTDRVTPDGKKVLFVEEVQSDWQKALHKQTQREADPTQTWDYKASKLLHDKGMPEYAPLDKGSMEIAEHGKNPNLKPGYIPIPEVPDAPLARDYQSLAMKRILRMASEEGYDSVGWTTGKQQADRYNKSLLDGVQKVSYDPSKSLLQATMPDGSIRPMNIAVSQLPDAVGQATAEKLLTGVEKKTHPGAQNALDMANAWVSHVEDSMRQKYGPHATEGFGTSEMTDSEFDTLQDAHKKLEDAQKLVKNNRVSPASVDVKDMQVGSTGYSNIYDKQLPQIADKIGKSFGGKTQVGEINTTQYKHPSDWPDVDRHQWSIADKRDLDGFKQKYPGLSPADAVLKAAQTGHITYDYADRLRRILAGIGPDAKASAGINIFHLTPQLKSSSISKGFPLFELGAGAVGLAGASAAKRKQDQDSKKPRSYSVSQ